MANVVESMERAVLENMKKNPELYTESTQDTEQKECVIDNDLRVINIPQNLKNLGVEHDDDVHIIKFKLPKMYCGFDLSEFSIRINYLNAASKGDVYVVNDKKVESDYITFSWLIGRSALAKKGDTIFNVCLKKVDTEGIVLKEFNTTIAKLTVLEGLETLEQVETQYPDIIEQIRLSIDTVEGNFGQQIQAVIAEGTKQVNVVTATANEKIEAMNEILDAFESDAFMVGKVTGSDITADQTHQGAAIIKEIQGGMKQGKTNGYQLFDASKLPTKSEGGATVTNNGDGSFTISGSGNLTSVFNVSYAYRGLPNFIKDVPESYTISGIESAYPSCELNILRDANKSPVKLISKDRKTMSLTQEDIDAIKNGTYIVVLYIYGTNGRPITPGTIKPMINKGLEPLPWEPFTGGESSPNPDYPQEIKAIGGNGWFSGEITTGGYGYSNGEYSDNRNPSGTLYYYTDKYKEYIPCKYNDVIRVIIEKSKSYHVFFYREDKTFITYASSDGSVTVPEGAAYFRFDISKETTVYPDYKALGKVVVLVNGKYAAKIETHGKNLLDFESVLKEQKNAYEKISSNEFKVKNIGNFYSKPFKIFNEDRKLTLSGTVKSIVDGGDWRLELMNAKNEVVCTTSTSIKSGMGSKVRMNYSTEGQGALFKNIQIEVGAEQTYYEPYKSSVSYIPLDSPLYEGDKIYLEDGELWEYRENKRVVFDGSEDENWTREINYVYISAKDASTHSKPYLNKFEGEEYNNSASMTSGKSTISSSKMITLCLTGVTNGTVQNFKTWLQSNPVEVVYKLATPTLKKLGSAEAFNLRTFDERTYIEVVGAKELGTENTFIVPRNQSGGLITDAFATSKRNEINAAGQANLVNRISALEQLAVKESV